MCRVRNLTAVKATCCSQLRWDISTTLLANTGSYSCRPSRHPTITNFGNMPTWSRGGAKSLSTFLSKTAGYTRAGRTRKQASCVPANIPKTTNPLATLNSRTETISAVSNPCAAPNPAFETSTNNRVYAHHWMDADSCAWTHWNIVQDAPHAVAQHASGPCGQPV